MPATAATGEPVSNDKKTAAVRLLVVDDDPTVLLTAQMALADHGYLLRTVGCGEEALAAAELERPDAILLDVVMPGISGFETCRRIRARMGPNLPILVVTSLNDSASIERAYADGATAFVTKPINWPMLRHQLQFVLRASRDRARLAESEERYALAASGANDGLWDWDIGEQRLYLSPRWHQQLGLRPGEMRNDMDEWLARIHPDDRLNFRNALNAHLAGHEQKFEIEYRVRTRDAGYRWMLCRGLAIRDDARRALRIAGSQTDISARKMAEERLLHDALHDGLTGLANRQLLLERITHALKLARRRSDHRFAIAVVDLDRFRNVNDSLGHLVGDQLLCRIAERIGALLPGSDTVARISGDEFGILFEDIGDSAAAERLIESIHRDVVLPYDIEGRDIVVTASVGVVLEAASYERADHMLRDAAIALHHAKARGRNRLAVFEGEMHVEISAQLKLESELRAALARQELRVVYQPIRRLDDDRVAGFEALLRWDHPQLGLLTPDAFLGLAEETGLIIPIGQWMLREATRQLAAWQASTPLARDCYVSVNLSSSEFAHPEIREHVRNALAESGLDPSHLRLEVTETALIENVSQSARTLDALRGDGVATAIDDFGTGYASFGYLHQLSFDALKIDRVFIEHIDRDARSQAIVRAIVSLARELGLSVVAEGGENNEEVECLRAAGCEYNQGFAYARPLSPDAIGALLSNPPALH